MKEIKNREELVDMIAEKIIETEKRFDQYQTDIYVEIDDDGNGTVFKYENPGGNFGVEGNGICKVYSVKENYDKPIDFYETMQDICEAVGKTEEELTKEATEYFKNRHYDDYELCDNDLLDYIKRELNDELLNYLLENWDSFFEYDNYVYVANACVEEVENQMNEEE